MEFLPPQKSSQNEWTRLPQEKNNVKESICLLN